MKKYWYQLGLAFINRIEYRQELITSIFIGLIVFVGLFFFWNAYYEGDNSELINGYTLQGILVYYIFVRIISEIIESKAGFRMSEMILDGTISNFLIKPFNFKLWILSEEVGRVILDVFFKSIVYILFFQFLIGFPMFKVENILLFLISIFLSFFISFNLFFLVGCIAFIIEAAGGFNYALRRTIFFLSGGLLPLSFFPETFQRVLEFLPFMYIFDLPISFLFDGNTLSSQEILTGLGIQIFWVGILWFFGNRVFTFFVKRNQSVGI